MTLILFAFHFLHGFRPSLPTIDLWGHPSAVIDPFIDVGDIFSDSVMLSEKIDCHQHFNLVTKIIRFQPRDDSETRGAKEPWDSIRFFLFTMAIIFQWKLQNFKIETKCEISNTLVKSAVHLCLSIKMIKNGFGELLLNLCFQEQIIMIQRIWYLQLRFHH